MTGRIHAFEPRPGGIYRMALTYGGPGHAAPGKTAQHTDIVRGRFLALIPDRQDAQLVEFESEDPAFAGEMTMTWSLAAVTGGTRVTIVCAKVPEGITQEVKERSEENTYD